MQSPLQPQCLHKHCPRIDLIPNIIPTLGYVDDLLVVPPGIVQDCRIHRITSRIEPNPASRSNRPLMDKPPSHSALQKEWAAIVYAACRPPI